VGQDKCWVALDEEVTGKEGAASAPAVTNRNKIWIWVSSRQGQKLFVVTAEGHCWMVIRGMTSKEAMNSTPASRRAL
jgi:hypothetical protein